MAKVYRPVPAPGRVVVRVVEAPTEQGGIVLLRNKERPSTCGEVVAAGAEYNIDGVDYAPLYKVGDKVLFGQYSGIEVTIGRDRVIVLAEKDIISTLVLFDEDEDGELLPSAATLTDITAAPR